MKTTLTTGILALTILSNVVAQGVTIGSNTPPDPSAVLDLQSGQQGFALPRLTTTQRDAIISPAQGLQIYNTDTECINISSNNTWKQICGECAFSIPAISSNSPLCDGDQIKLNAGTLSGATYQWTGPDGFISNLQNPVINGASTNNSGSYFLQVTLNGCTSQSVQTYVSVVSSPTGLTVSSNKTEICIGETAQLTATGTPPGTNYSWTGPGSFTSSLANPSLTALVGTPSGYYVAQPDISGCVGTSDSVYIITKAPFTLNLNTCGQTGRSGPSQLQCDNTYGAGVVTVSNGIQEWTVPYTGTYTIETGGAKGGSPNGGWGAMVRGDFQLNAGDVLHILVGQEGLYTGNCSAGSGGGTFVVTYTGGVAVPLIISGGGGAGNNYYVGNPGLATQGSSPNGATGSCSGGGGGGGFQTDGTASACGGLAFINGGLGGTSNADGGFGGGGASNAECDSGMDSSGGGGYQGGTGANSNGAGNGGYSYNSGTNTSGTSGANNGPGYVKITYTCP